MADKRIPASVAESIALLDLVERDDIAVCYEEKNLAALVWLKTHARDRYEELFAAWRKRKVPRLRELDQAVDRLGKQAAAAAKAKATETSGDDFVRDQNGNIVAGHQANVRLAVEQLGVSLRYDDFRGWPLIEGLEGYGPSLDDHAARRLWLAVDETFGFRPRRDFFDEVVSDLCYQNRFHPVRDFLDSLDWDGVDRLDGWLAKYGGAEDTPYVAAVGALVLVAAVRRVRRPGSKFDELLVLEGAQGLQKSTALEALAINSDWFTDSVPLNARDKEMIEGHSGKWICEIADLQGLTKAEIERVKAVLSRKVDRARLAYGRLPVEVARQCIFVGTTNGEKYLSDPTGNRRFWPVHVGQFDLETLTADRDQLWAEAAAREAAGASIRLDESLWAEAAKEQAKRAVDNPFAEPLANAIGDRDGVLFVTDAYDLLGIPPKQRSQFDAVRLGEAMRSLGFEYANRRRKNGAQARAWVRGGSGERRHFYVTRDFGFGGREVTLARAGDTPHWDFDEETEFLSEPLEPDEE